MVMSIRRHRSHASKHADSATFCDQEYKWINSFRISALDPKSYKITSNFEKSSRTIQIYHAKHEPTNHSVVIKLVNLEYEESLDYITYEINTTRHLRHANLLPILSSFVSDNYLWNILACAEHGSVDIWSKPNGLPELAIAFIIRDTLSALSYLHKRGIIHRAVCGPHILVNSNGNCMLTGLKYSTTVLKDGRWQPTIHDYPPNAIKILNYLAPEILEQNLLGYNSKSDIYSVGIVCCELSNGCVPFEDISVTEMLLDKLTGNFPRPLDSTCEEIVNFPTDVEDLTIEVKEKFNLYKSRTFSSSFHKFTVDFCLNFDSYSRPTAAELSRHNFIKQTKKSSQNLLQLLNAHQSRSTNTNTKNESIKTVFNKPKSDPVDLMHLLSLKDSGRETKVKFEINDDDDWIF